VNFDLDALDLESLIDVIDRSGISEFSLITADGELRVSKTPADRAHSAAVVQLPAPTIAAAPAAEVVAAPQPEASPVATSATAPAASASTGNGFVEIRTPLLGVFYRAPNPGAPPFVEVGARVEADTTVAIIEAMKVFTAVPAGVCGVVTEVLVQDREFVEYDQALFRVTPDAAPGAQPSAP
jgi:acetyl-CoA carboxylase biotin carboxyl carrier protein